MCTELKEHFWFGKAPHHKDGLTSECRPCRNKRGREKRSSNPEKDRSYRAEWRKNNPGCNMTRYWLGSTPEQAWKNYNDLLQKQEHSCAICKKHKDNFKTPLEIDHHHDTLKVRGLLCANCNTALGLLKEDPVSCLNMVNYIAKSL